MNITCNSDICEYEHVAHMRQRILFVHFIWARMILILNMQQKGKGLLCR
jgi:hypothetical protein